MNYSLLIVPRALKQIARLPAAIQDKLDATISGLSFNPRPRNCLKLSEREGWRLRVGDYRVIYEINDELRSIVVFRVGHRREVYR